MSMSQQQRPRSPSFDDIAAAASRASAATNPSANRKLGEQIGEIQEKMVRPPFMTPWCKLLPMDLG